jgi:hypothetical protein
VDVFKDRRDETYLKTLRERLTIDGTNGLLSRAIKIATPSHRQGQAFTRRCRIDFAGIAATNLFDTGCNFVDSCVADCLEDLFKNSTVFNEQGIFIELRFLLIYPYSTSAISRIQAERSRNRSSMANPSYVRDFSLVESVDEDMFMQSTYVRAQELMLEQLQEWVDKYAWPIYGMKEPSESPNRVYLRFAPVSPNLCMLFVNDCVFTDAYLLAKETREATRLAQLAPLVQICSVDDPKTFAAFEDHFRYLWDLDTSIYHSDATDYQRGRPATLKAIKRPASITFENKGAHIKAKVPTYSDDDVRKWRFKVSRLLTRHSTLPAPAPDVEALFITCSWQQGADGIFVPNADAQELAKMLEIDLGQRRRDPVISVRILEAVKGEFLTKQLFATLEGCTLGLVLMTGDIKGDDNKSYSKPNVYHEHGFLMKHLPSQRVMLACETGIVIPSNIHDVPRTDFSRQKLILQYREVLVWLGQVCLLAPSIMVEALQRHSTRLNESVGNGIIEIGEAKEAKRKVSQDLESYTKLQ